MHRFWNLKTQFVSVMVALLFGALLLQGYIQNRNKERLLREVQTMAQAIANEVTNTVVLVIEESRSLQAATRTRRVRHRAEDCEYCQRLARSRRAGRLVDVPLAEIQTAVLSLANDSPGEMQLLDYSACIYIPPTEGVAAFVGESASRSRARSVLISASPAAPIADYSTGPIVHHDERGEVTHIDITDQINAIRDVFEQYRRIDLWSTVGVFICGIAAALYLGYRLTRPVYHVVDAFDRVAAGDLNTRVSESAATGEFAVLGQQFNRMVASLGENRALEQELSQRERVQHMGDLAAGIAHDVRNPLNAIHLNMGQIRDEFVPDAPESRERFLKFTSDVQSEVERLNRLVSNFLSLAQPSALTREAVEPNELIEELRRLLRKEALGRTVDLRLDLEADLPTLCWDRQEMKSALLNISMNALQAMEPAGGRLDIISSVRAAGEEGSQVVITLVDTGKGIPAEDLERVFVPYFTTRAGGTGLGMAIARRVVERNGGRLELRSRVGEGTSVAFVFPISTKEKRPSAGEAGC